MTLVLVYEYTGHVSVTQYAKREDSIWFCRRAGFGRRGVQQEFGPWSRVIPEMRLVLDIHIDPDSPPDKVRVEGKNLRRLKNYAVRLPTD